MKARYDKHLDIVILGEGSALLESLYDDIRKPVFIDVINKMSHKVGTYKKQENVYLRTSEVCQNLSVMATLNLNLRYNGLIKMYKLHHLGICPSDELSKLFNIVNFLFLNLRITIDKDYMNSVVYVSPGGFRVFVYSQNFRSSQIFSGQAGFDFLDLEKEYGVNRVDFLGFLEYRLEQACLVKIRTSIFV